MDLFHASVPSTPSVMAIQPDGKLVVRAYNKLVRIESNGARDNSFKEPEVGTYNDIIVIDNDNSIFTADSRTLQKFHPDGSPASFSKGYYSNTNKVSLNIQSDHKLILSGDFSTYNNEVRNGLVRLNNVVETGVLEEKKTTHNWTVFPNPGSDLIHLQSDEIYAESVISIVNGLGQQMLSKAISQGRQGLNVNVADYPSGVYVLTITSGSFSENIRFVKQ